MQLTVEEKKVNISGYGIGDIEALNANQLFNGIINKLFLIKTACTFKCSSEIKNGLEKFGAINNEDSEIVKLNKKYQNFLDLCIQFCKENYKKHCENYKNYIAKKNFSKANKELADKVQTFVDEHDYDREEDCWTMNKGGYDVDTEIVNKFTMETP